MKRYSGFGLVATLIALWAPHGSAGSDLAIELAVMPRGITPPNSEITVEFSVTNYGPDDIGPQGFSIISDDTLIVLDSPTSSTCPWFSAQARSPDYTVFFDWNESLPVGTTARCTATMDVDGRARGYPVLEWEVRALLNEDPNETNDVAIMRLVLFQLPVAVPALGVTSTLALLFSLVFLSWRRQRKSFL